MRMRPIVAVLVTLVTVARPAVAEEDFSKFEEEFAKDSGISQMPSGTNLADYSESAGEPGLKGNETPGMVRQDISDLKDQQLINSFLEPKQSAAVQHQLEVAQVRLKIAEARLERDKLRKAKRTREADTLDKEIHTLKRMLAAKDPKPKTSISSLFKPDNSGIDD